MESYLIATNNELNCYDATCFGGALYIPESNVVIFTCMFVERDKVFADVTHMSVGVAIHNVLAGALVAGGECIVLRNIQFEFF